MGISQSINALDRKSRKSKISLNEYNKSKPTTTTESSSTDTPTHKSSDIKPVAFELIEIPIWMMTIIAFISILQPFIALGCIILGVLNWMNCPIGVYSSWSVMIGAMLFALEAYAMYTLYKKYAKSAIICHIAIAMLCFLFFATEATSFYCLASQRTFETTGCRNYLYRTNFCPMDLDDNHAANIAPRRRVLMKNAGTGTLVEVTVPPPYQHLNISRLLLLVFSGTTTLLAVIMLILVLVYMKGGTPVYSHRYRKCRGSIVGDKLHTNWALKNKLKNAHNALPTRREEYKYKQKRKAIINKYLGEKTVSCLANLTTA